MWVTITKLLQLNRPHACMLSTLDKHKHTEGRPVDTHLFQGMTKDSGIGIITGEASLLNLEGEVLHCTLRQLKHASGLVALQA